LDYQKFTISNNDLQEYFGEMEKRRDFTQIEPQSSNLKPQNAEKELFN
jgi:hypothetical protein